jgi:hypothetical protein
MSMERELMAQLLLGNPGAQAARYMSPNLTSLLMREPAPPIANLPEHGKVPSTDDPRYGPAAFEAADLLSNFIPFGMASRAAKVAGRFAPETEMLASRSASLYNPSVKPARPFGADYPAGAAADDAGRLLADIEGRPLAARHVVGRRVVGGGDEALAPAQYDAVTAGAIGSVPAGVTARALPRGSVGVYRELRGESAPERSIGFLSSLPPAKAEKVVAHEMGHMVDELVGRIPTAGIDTELRQLYNTLGTGQERTRHLTGPQHVGYRGDAVPRELMAEAIRGYMADPNYLKTVAPKTAAAIRAAVNSHPTLSKVIQFNTMAALLLGGQDGSPEAKQ